MRFYLPLFMVSLIGLAAQPSAAQNKDEAAKAKRIAAIQREIENLQKEFAQLRGEMRDPPAFRRKAAFEEEMRELQLRIVGLRLELMELQPVAEPKTGVNVNCSLQLTPVRGKMIPLPITPYRDGATIRILAAKDKKVLAEGKTDLFGHVFLAVPAGKHLLVYRLGSDKETFGPPLEVTVEQDKKSAVAILINGVLLKPDDRPDLRR